MYSCGTAKFNTTNTQNKCSLTQIYKTKRITFIYERVDQKIYPEKDKLKKLKISKKSQKR